MKNAFISVFVSLVLMASVEMLARVAGTVNQDIAAGKSAASEPWLAYSPVLGWERKPGFKGLVAGSDREFDESGLFTVDTPQIAGAKERKRVVFVGDSNTFGFGVPTTRSFAEVVEQLSPGIDAINLGVIGYSSYQGRIAVQRLLPVLRPDLLVVSFNFNDRRYVLGPDAVDGAAEFERVYRFSKSATGQFESFLEISYFYRALRRMLTVVGLRKKPENEETSIMTLRPRVGEESYRQNLSAIAEEAGRMGVPVLFVLLRDDPVRSDHLKKGIASLEKKDPDTAIAYLNSAVQSHRMFSELARLHLAKAHEAKGNLEKSREILMTSALYHSFSGGTLIRRDTDYNRIMKEVAAKYRAPVMDGAAVLEANPSVFIDFCHFNTEGHRLLGELLAARIPEILGKASSTR